MTTNPLDAKRYREIRDAAGLVLVEHSDGRMPVMPRAIFEHMGGCRVVAYSQYEQQHLARHSLQAAGVFASRDACTLYERETGRCLVLYDDGDNALRVPGRLRWTLAHEMGHVVLGHLKDHDGARFDLGGLPEESYRRLEREADYFAAMLLAHPALLRACAIASADQLQGFCGLSQPAAQARFAQLRRSVIAPSAVDALVEKHFEQVIWERNLPFATEGDLERYGR